MRGNPDHEIRGLDLHRGFIRQRHSGVKGVKHLFALAAIGDHIVAPQQTKMMTHRGLWKPQFFAKGSNVPFALGQGQKNIQTRFVG
jgi:hypothetical protein